MLDRSKHPGDVPTFGIEEEFLLSDTVTGELRQDADAIRSAALAVIDEGIDHELRTAMLEIGTAVCNDRREADADLRLHRAAIQQAAAAAGAVVLATATHPTAPANAVAYTSDERYQRMASAYGRLADDALVCGCHVHVRIPSKQAGVDVIDRIGPWLAPILAMSANSPLFDGRETGFESWRHQIWSRWPTAGPTSNFGTVDRYDEIADSLVATGAAIDRGMLYYDARLSEQWPTVEIRVADVCLDHEDAVLIGVLVRALVMTALASDDPAREVPVGLLRAANFVASRNGVAHELLDPLTMTLAPADVVLDNVLAHTAVALDATNDQEFVTEGIERIVRGGGGAARQRTAWRQGAEAAVRSLVAL